MAEARATCLCSSSPSCILVSKVMRILRYFFFHDL